MKSNYLKSILTFGLVLPFGGIILALLLVSSIKSHFLKDFKMNQSAFKNEQSIIQNTNLIKKSLQEKQVNFESAEAIMGENAYQEISNLLNDQVGKSPTKSMVLIEQNRVKDAKSNVKMVDSNAQGGRFALRGTFTEIQKSLLTLEYAYPNLFASNCTIKPSGKLLEIKVNYLIWTTENE